MADFLFEIGLEEVPARMLAGAQAELVKRMLAMLSRERLVGAEAKAVGYSTPRRLAVMVRGVSERQEEVAEELMGPAVRIAYKDGVAGPAAVAFAKKAGVEVSELRVVTTAKGEYCAATAVRAGRGAADVIAAELPKELAEIYWAKNMYWRAGKPERFVRPVRWMVALLGEAVVPVSFGGQVAGRTTFGHRVLFGAEGIEIGAPGEYAEALRGASVMVEVEARRHTIRKALDRVCRGVEGARWREDHALVDKMTHMTEWPSVILGGFEEEYLALPEEVLVTVMRDHQNYFAVEGEDGRLAPHFLAVLNTVADAAGEAVIRHGNERVLRARFNDARFFWDFDQRVSLEGRVGLLEKVTFQKDLGSYSAKSERVRGVARVLGEMVRERAFAVDLGALDTAARLAKTDLTTELVKEFTELQGVVGGLYARAQGLGEAVAAAIADQYKPVSMEDGVPRTAEGALLAIADKADTVAGMFRLGLEPTGSKDPFALRRAANGIVKILAEGSVLLGLGEIARAVAGGEESLVRKVEVFFAERLEFYLREARGQAYDVVAAVLAVGADEVKDAVARAEAVTAVRGSEDFLAVCAAFKRMKNILEQADMHGLNLGINEPSGQLQPFIQTQHDLGQQASEIKVKMEGMHDDYVSALQSTATLRPYIDAFFQAVMIMDPDPEVRHQRLALLRGIVRQFSTIADFSEIVVAS